MSSKKHQKTPSYKLTRKTWEVNPQQKTMKNRNEKRVSEKKLIEELLEDTKLEKYDEYDDFD